MSLCDARDDDTGDDDRSLPCLNKIKQCALSLAPFQPFLASFQRTGQLAHQPEGRRWCMQARG